MVDWEILLNTTTMFYLFVVKSFVETMRYLLSESTRQKNMIFCYNFGPKWYCSERFGTQLSFDMWCAVKSLKVEET